MKMNRSTRIIFNVIATYGRSLYALVLGLLGGRWVLIALGQSDFGIYGVVAGLVAFITFFGDIFSSAVVRYYAYEIGRANVARDKECAIEACRQWFNTALLIHILLPTFVIILGYPVAKWAVSNWLNIPSDRIAHSVWILRLVCIQCFVMLAGVPFRALYTAKQLIAELTVYSFVSTTAQFLMIWYMAFHEGQWLLSYAVGMCLVTVLPQLVLCARASIIFPEVALRFKYMIRIKPMRELSAFAGWNFIGALGRLLNWQGMPIIVNKYLGVIMNATLSIGGKVSSHASSLAGAMMGAFSPAIINAYGEGNTTLMRTYVNRACKFSGLGILLFAVPISLEAEEIVNLWLGDPPPKVAGLCISAMVFNFVENATLGLWIAVRATGNIARFQVCTFFIEVGALSVLWILVSVGCGIYSVAYVTVAMVFFIAAARIFFARKMAGIVAKEWFFKVFMPLFGIACLSLCAGAIPRVFLDESFARVCISTMASLAVMLPVTWKWGLSSNEREFFVTKLTRIRAIQKRS